MRRAWPFVIATFVLAACRPAPSTDPEHLVGVDWQLTRLTVAGEERAVSADATTVVHFDADGTYGGKTCNFFGGEFSVDGPILKVSPGISTSMLCGGALGELERERGPLSGDESRWSIRSGMLRIESGDVRGEFVPWDPAPPTDDLSILARADADDAAHYRFGYVEGASGALSLVAEVRVIDWEAWKVARLIAEEEGVEAASLPVGERLFVMGHTPRSTVRVEYRLASEEPVRLDVHRLPRDLMGFGGLVDDPGGVVVAFDAAGRELGRFGPVAPRPARH